jgi:tRNA threonylcarbamoyladenosine biosynthesis protein TsaE
MPLLNGSALKFMSSSPEQTRATGGQLGSHLDIGDVVCLQGDLGAGKTTFVQGVAQGWGSMDPVSSPTFILVNVYRRADGAQLFHLDTYRLESVPEAEQLDLDSMLMQGPLLIEWPERLGNLIPEERLWINFEHIDEEQRELRFNSQGARYIELLNGIRRSAVGAK